VASGVLVLRSSLGVVWRLRTGKGQGVIQTRLAWRFGAAATGQLGGEAEWSYFACLYRSGHNVPIGRVGTLSGGVVRIGDFRLAGRYLTLDYTQRQKFISFDPNTVEQFDLQSGRRVFALQYEEGTVVMRRGTQPPLDSSSSLVTNTKGDAAWAIEIPGCWTSACAGLSEAVIAHDAQGTRTLAAYSPAQTSEQPLERVRDLSINKTAVSWQHGPEGLTNGQRLSSPLR